MSSNFLSHGSVSFNSGDIVAVAKIAGATDPLIRPMVVVTGAPRPGNNNNNINYWVTKVSYSGGQWKVTVGRSDNADVSSANFTVIGTTSP